MERILSPSLSQMLQTLGAGAPWPPPVISAAPPTPQKVTVHGTGTAGTRVIVYPSTWETLLGEGVLRGPGTLWGMQCVHVGNAAETFLMGEKAIQELCDPRWASEEESRRVMQLGIHEGTYTARIFVVFVIVIEVQQ